MRSIVKNPKVWLVLLLMGDLPIIVITTLRRNPPPGTFGIVGAPPRFSNWLGHDAPLIYLYAVAFLIVFYIWKIEITHKAGSKRAAIQWYLVMCAASIPYIGLFASDDWNNRFALAQAIWVGGPIRILF